MSINIQNSDIKRGLLAVLLQLFIFSYSLCAQPGQQSLKPVQAGRIMARGGLTEVKLNEGMIEYLRNHPDSNDYFVVLTFLGDNPVPLSVSFKGGHSFTVKVSSKNAIETSDAKIEYIVFVDRPDSQDSPNHATNENQIQTLKGQDNSYNGKK